VRKDFLAIYFEKSTRDTKLFVKLADHGLVERLTSLDMTTWEYPRSIFLMSSHEDLTFGIPEKCTDDRKHNKY
jgi:hypothetical protein